MARYQLAFSSTLATGAEQVRAVAFTPAGVNAELWPWLRMRFPGAPFTSLQQVPVGVTLGRCWLLLFGVLPADYDDLCFERIEPQGFVETSQLLSQRVWRHERQIVGAAGSPQCTVHDRVSFTPRLGVPGFLSRLLIGRLFAWRHYRLRRRFGHAMP